MVKISIIQDFCSDILCCPWITEETMNHLVLSATLVEDEINLTDCNTLHMTAQEQADFIRKHIHVCTGKIKDDVYFLLIEMENLFPN